MDKSSAIEDAIKYLKRMQDKGMNVEEEEAVKEAVESALVVNKSEIVVEDAGSSYRGGYEEEQRLLEVEARVCENRILVKVHCRKEKGVLVDLLCKVESLNMNVVNASATVFGNVALDVSIMAEVEKEFNLTGKEVATALRAALLQR